MLNTLFKGEKGKIWSSQKGVLRYAKHSVIFWLAVLQGVFLWCVLRQQFVGSFLIKTVPFQKNVPPEEDPIDDNPEEESAGEEVPPPPPPPEAPPLLRVPSAGIPS